MFDRRGQHRWRDRAQRPAKANGVATCPATLSPTLAALLLRGYSARFAGDSIYEPTSATGSFLG